MRWDDDLAGVARRIAGSGASPLRVVAGPGTGKTYSLTRRVMRLLQEGAAPSRLLACTFTRTAAEDMKKALKALNVAGVESVRAGTLHAYCFSVLAQAAVLAITGREPRTLVEFEMRFMLQDICSEAFGGIRECEKRVRAFESAWARLQIETPGIPRDQLDVDFEAALLGWLRFHRATLIGEVVPLALSYLKDNPLSPYRGMFDHVLVDEYQDLNKADQVLLDIVADSGTLTVVGDEDQAIYSFRFAHPDGIAEFPDAHPGTSSETLQECLRCPTRIVEMANSLIAHNTRRQPRRLIPLAGNPPGEVHVVQWRDMRSEAAGIADFIAQRIGEGRVEPGEVLVLAPRRQFGQEICKRLEDRGITALSFFGEEAFHGDPTKLDGCVAEQAFVLLSLLANREDRVALRCWCGFGSASLRKGAWSRLRAHCEQNDESPWSALERLSKGALRLPHTSELVARFEELQRRLAELAPLRGTVLLDTLMPPDEPTTILLRPAIKFSEEDSYDAQKLLEAVRAIATQPELPTDVNYVRVMSLYKSNGLTADLVVVTGCIQGLIPFIPSTQTSTEQEATLQEQRRLFYVAITRARSTLVLSSVAQIPIKDAYKLQVPIARTRGQYAVTIASRFLECLTKLLVEGLPADERAAEVEEGEMDVGPPLIAHRQPAEAAQPRQRALDDPAVPAEPLARLDAAARDARDDAAPPAGDATARVVVTLVGMQLGRAPSGTAASPTRLPDRWDRVERGLQEA
jgi:DNA helicase II / ATP-dependent DNA helicase PcrA